MRKPSPALVVACVALFVALGGTSYAVTQLPRNSVGTKQLKNAAVTGAKVKAGSLDATAFSSAAKVALTGNDGANGKAGTNGLSYGFAHAGPQSMRSGVLDTFTVEVPTAGYLNLQAHGTIYTTNIGWGGRLCSGADVNDVTLHILVDTVAVDGSEVPLPVQTPGWNIQYMQSYVSSGQIQTTAGTHTIEVALTCVAGLPINNAQRNVVETGVLVNAAMTTAALPN